MAGGGPEPLTKDQVVLLKSTFRALDPYRLGSFFYDSLFKQYPQLRPMFSANLEDQITKIVSVIELIVFSFEEKSFGKFVLQDSLIVPMRDLGQRHSKLGVLNEHYPIVNRILLESIQEVGGKVIDPAASKVWTLALDHITYAMLNDSVVVPEAKKTPKDTFSWIKRLLKKD